MSPAGRFSAATLLALGVACGRSPASPLTPPCLDGTPERASDAHNCGACGHDCLGGTCAKGACQPRELAHLKNAGNLIAVAGGWIVDSWRGLLFVPDGGGAPSTIWQGHVSGLATDGAHVFWISDGIWRCRLDGSDCRGLIEHDDAGMRHLLVEGGRLFWSDGGQVLSLDLNKPGSQVQSLVDVTKSTSNSSVYALAVAGSEVFWVSERRLLRRRLDGGPVEEVAFGWELHCPSLLTAGAVLFLYDSWTSVLHRVPLSSNTSPTALATLPKPPHLPYESCQPVTMAFDPVGDTLFLADTARLHAIDTKTGSSRLVASGTNGEGLVIDEHALTYTSDHALMQVAR